MDKSETARLIFTCNKWTSRS